MFVRRHASTYYQLLEIKPTASLKEIKSQYYKLCKQAHPDATGKHSETFIQLTEAYNTLKDPKKRREYDRQMAIVAFNTPPASPATIINVSREEAATRDFWAAQKRQRADEQEAKIRNEEEKLEQVVRRNRLLIMGSIAVGYLLSLLLR